MAGMEEGTKCNQSAAKAPEIKGLESSRQNHMLFNTRADPPPTKSAAASKAALKLEGRLAPEVPLSGLNWTAILRKMPHHESPQTTTAQLCAQQHSFTLSCSQ